MMNDVGALRSYLVFLNITIYELQNGIRNIRQQTEYKSLNWYDGVYDKVQAKFEQTEFELTRLLYVLGEKAEALRIFKDKMERYVQS